MQSFVHLFVGISAVRSLIVAEPTNCNSGVYCHFCDPCNSLSRASWVSASLRWLGCGALFSPTLKQLLMRAAKRSLLLRELFRLGYQSPCWWNPRLYFLLACLRTVDPSPGRWGLLWCAVIPHSSFLSEYLLGCMSILPTVWSVVLVLRERLTPFHRWRPCVQRGAQSSSVGVTELGSEVCAGHCGPVETGRR